MKKKKAESFKVQPSLDQFTNHVLQKLIGIKGKSAAEVASFILKDWIGDHIDELRGYGITVTRKDGELKL